MGHTQHNNLHHHVPSWDLTDLYGSPEDPRIDHDLQEIQKNIGAFRELYDQRCEHLTPEALVEAIKFYEDLHARLDCLCAYGHLVFAQDTTVPGHVAVYQKIQEQTTTLRVQLSFFVVQLLKLPETQFDIFQKDVLLAPYRAWLSALSDERPHTLSEELEEKLQMKAMTSQHSWVRLFEETIHALKVCRDGHTSSLNQLLHLLMSEKREVRAQAFQDISGLFEEKASLMTLITNTLAQDKAMDDAWRKYARPDAPMNLANRLSEQVVDGLVETVRHNYSHLSHRYYRLKAKWLGQEKLALWDRLAPLPLSQDRPVYTWDQAQTMVLESYYSFSPRIGALAQRFFDHAWIDAVPREGKDIGAFCHTVVPSHHPYVLVNFRGGMYDITTLAHEIGHGVHQLLSNTQTHLNAHPPLILAETASVFGEMITFKKLLNEAPSEEWRRAIMARKVEDMLNTVVRQIAFYCFERKVHEARREGEISQERLCTFWMETQRDALGDSFEWVDSYRYFWTYISHFIRSPFYVYAYAFGDCFVNALYGLYEEGFEGFEDAYIDFLSRGSTQKAEEAVRCFGFDGLTPSFWQKGLDVMGRYIDQLEQMA